MSGETAPQNEKKLSPEEIIVLKDKFRDEGGAPSPLAVMVCDRMAKDKADSIESEIGRRPSNEEEWLFMNSATAGMQLYRVLSLPGEEWPEGFVAPEEFNAALIALTSDMSMVPEERHG